MSSPTSGFGTDRKLNRAKAFMDYLRELERALATHDASEGSHYGTLKTLIETIDKTVNVQVLPLHIKQGAPDLKVSRGITIAVGYIEAKDIGIDLDAVAKSRQLKRYLELPNLILTNYLEFRWYADGKLARKSFVGTLKDGKMKPEAIGMQDTASLFDRFLSHKGGSAETPKELARRMARLAHFIREEIVDALKATPPSDSLLSQLVAFRENLIPDLDEAKFGDMYAQTITYGLFAAKLQDPLNPDFSRERASNLIPKTNPFLRKTFQHIAVDLDDHVAFWVDELVELLRRSDMETVLKNFGKGTAKEDPVVHFYETFLYQYDAKMRKSRGVYYTPEPVVSYIVRSIDCLLKRDFNKPHGLADKSVLILDPAVGTATFLYMVIREIFEAQETARQQGYWDSYVSQNLLKRIFGFELLMAPYTVAHLKLGLLLKETGYTFSTDERLGVYLSNTLEESFKRSEQLAGFNKYIVDEANAAAEIKKEKAIMVVLGNPPYRGISANASRRTVTDPKTGKPKQEFTWIGQLIQGYKMVDGKHFGERKHWLDDDYVKFLRFGQWRIDSTGQGVLAFITNHSYLNDPTFRGMRQSLMNSFSNIYILNLHGSHRRGEHSRENAKDENVFDIKQGVAIGIFVKEQGKNTLAKVRYADVYGLQGSWPKPEKGTKYYVLGETNALNTNWKELQPSSPFYSFMPHKEGLRSEYDQWARVTEIFNVYSTGILTFRDKMVVGFDNNDLKARLDEIADPAISDDVIREKYCLGRRSDKYEPGDTRGWKLSGGRKMLSMEDNPASHVQPCLYRPFDIRSMYYADYMIDWPRTDVMRHMLNGQNLGLVSARSNKSSQMDHFFCSRYITELKCGESTTGSYLFPLYVYVGKGEMQFDSGERCPNLKVEFIKTIVEKLGLIFVEDGKGDLERTFGAEDILDYSYAIFHSPTYRTRYEEFLNTDFPRLPLTSDKALFKALVSKGAQLVALHLMDAPVLDVESNRVGYPIKGSHLVEKVSYRENTKRVYINNEEYFEGVEPEVWEFCIGGYKICQKWLKYRKDRMLTLGEMNHYQKIVVALDETIRLMAEIDQLIPGWPLN